MSNPIAEPYVDNAEGEADSKFVEVDATPEGFVTVTLMRPGTGIPPIDLDKVIGRKSRRNISAGETLTWSDIV